MDKQSKSLILRGALFLLILIISIGIGYKINMDAIILPIYNPSDLDPKLVDESVQGVTKFHKIGSFSLTSQEGKTVTEKDFENKIYVADFFFTTCQSICPKMTSQMQRLHIEFLDDDEIKLISHTVTPEIDSVPVLKAYAEQFQANPEKWLFVTGSKKEIYNLARKNYFAVTSEGDGGDDDFIHTENFVLIDKNKRIRGFYDGTSKDEVEKLIDDIYTLKREENTDN